MVMYSNDVDLVRWEPVIFRELALMGQTRCRGTDGVLSGTEFSSAEADFVAAGVMAGQVIYLTDAAGALEGAYEVAAVVSATVLTVSVVRAQGAEETVAPAGEGSGIGYRISTFDPQAEEVACHLREYFAVTQEAALGETASGTITDVGGLRQASVFGVLAAVFASGAAGDADGQAFWQKSLYYQKLFHTARVQLRLGVDTNGDSQADVVRDGGTVHLRRV